MKLTKPVIDSLAYTRKSGAQCEWDDELAGQSAAGREGDRRLVVLVAHAGGLDSSLLSPLSRQKDGQAV
jgi:hypothetical protein